MFESSELSEGEDDGADREAEDVGSESDEVDAECTRLDVAICEGEASLSGDAEDVDEWREEEDFEEGSAEAEADEVVCEDVVEFVVAGRSELRVDDKVLVSRELALVTVR